jgi:hypothetical protein
MRIDDHEVGSAMAAFRFTPSVTRAPADGLGAQVSSADPAR